MGSGLRGGWIVAAVLLASVAWCGVRPKAAPSQAPAAKSGYKAAVHLADLQEKRINESSGLAASRRTPGVFWTHNDSGGTAELFATDKKGRALATFSVSGAAAVDWEDMAAGGAGEEARLYVGDIGDNGLNRDDTCVYRLYEPEVDATLTGQTGKTMLAERFPFKYPDGHHDAETLMVHPTTEELFIVTKEETGVSGVYKFPAPLTRNRTVTLEKVGSVRFTNPLRLRGHNVGKLSTAGDIAPDGRRIVIRTYTDAFEWTLPAGGSVGTALAAKPRPIAVPWLGQYEAICYTLDGRSLLATSEGSPCPLWEVAGK
jgi:hypothetical protein